MALVLKLHSLAALKALQSDVAVLAATAQEGRIGVDADVVSKLAILIEPIPDTFPFALSLPWDAFSYPLRVCLAGAHSYAGDAVLFDDAEGPSISDIVLSGMTPRHVASLLEAVELMTTADVPTGVMRNDLNPAGVPAAGALVDQTVLPWISRAVREGFYLSRLAHQQASADRFFNWLDAQSDEMSPRVKEFADAHNFSVHHTGGGCLALYRKENDEWYTLLTDDDSSLPTDPDAPHYFGLYHEESEWWLATTATFSDFIAVQKTVLAVAQNRFNPKADGYSLDLVPILELAKHLKLVAKEEAAAVAGILSR